VVLRGLQSLLGRLYDLRVEHDVYDFLVTDRRSLAGLVPVNDRREPDEELLLAPVAEGPTVRSVLAAALVDLPHSLVDVSHRQGALELRGPHAAWLLNGGCPLDLDARVFPAGMCTRTVFAKTEIVLWRTAAEVFHVEVGRSFTDYLVGMLHEIARELPG